MNFALAKAQRREVVAPAAKPPILLSGGTGATELKLKSLRLDVNPLRLCAFASANL